MAGDYWQKLSEYSDKFGQNFVEQQVAKRKQQEEFQQALQLYLFKQQFEQQMGLEKTKQTQQFELEKMRQGEMFKQQYDPEAQFREKLLSLVMGQGQGQGQPSIPPIPQRQLGMIGGRPIMPNQIMPFGGGVQGDRMGGMPSAGGIAGLRPRLEGISVGGMNIKFPQSEAEFGQELAREKQKKLQDIELKSYISPQKQKDDLQKAKLAYNNLNFLEEKARKLPAGYSAIGSNILNFATRGEGNPQLALYEKQMPAMAVSIYREITGDTRLSDADAESRALPLLWNPARGEGESIKKEVFKDLRKLYQARIRLIGKGMYKPNPKDPAEFITPLEDIMAEAGINNQFGQTQNNNKTNISNNIRQQYNSLRSNGISSEKARQMLGL